MFPNILLGHLVGDYLLQNNWMALGKSKHKGLGIFPCTVHCLLYTAAMCLFTNTWELLWVAAIFLSHFPIDKMSLAEKYLAFINGRTIGGFLEGEMNQEYTPHIALRAGFTTLVYAAVDNTMHLLLLTGAWRILYGEF